jgi:hypothetical protein
MTTQATTDLPSAWGPCGADQPGYTPSPECVQLWRVELAEGCYGYAEQLSDRWLLHVCDRELTAPMSSVPPAEWAAVCADDLGVSQ